MQKLVDLRSVGLIAVAVLLTGAAQGQVLTGQNAFTDYSQEHPGVIRHLTVNDLPAP